MYSKLQIKRNNPAASASSEEIDRVEKAFRKFDVDGDGFIDWDEFKEVTKNLESEQAERMFNSCDKVWRLQEFIRKNKPTPN